MTWKEYALHRHLGASCLRRRGIDGEFVAFALEHDTVVALGDVRRDKSFANIGKHALGLARERIAMAAAAWRIEPEDITRFERIVSVAGRQPLCLGALRVDPDVAGAAGIAARAAVRWNDVLHRANGEARVLQIEVFAADAE